MPRRVRVQGDLFHGRVPEGSVYLGRAAPGLPASPYANPFKVKEPVDRDSPLWPFVARTVPGGTSGLARVSMLRAEDVVSAFSWWIIEQPGLMMSMAADLGGRDLACWCAIGKPCHADDLLDLAAELAEPLALPGPEGEQQ
jgi:Domain of unknown function (DUF4326)